MKGKILALLLVAPLLLGSGCATAHGVWMTTKQAARSTLTEQGRYERIIRKAYEAKTQGDLEPAVRLFAKAREMRPDLVAPAYGHALALGGLGRDGESLAALREAVYFGFFQESSMENEPAFDGYRNEPEFKELLKQVRANSDNYQAALKIAHRQLPAESAPSFDTLALLEESFAEQGAKLSREARRLDYDEQELERRRFRMRKLAALELYADEHPNASDREAASVNSVRTYYERASSSWRRWWREDASDLRESASRFIANHPESADRPEVILYFAASRIFGTLDDSYDWRTDLQPALDCSSALAELEPLAGDAESDKWAAAALALEALCLNETAPDDTEGIKQRYQSYLALPEPEWTDMIPLHLQLQREVKILSFKVGGLPAFSVTTVEGLEVGADNLPGEITLLEFWAPG
jgi:hypothetical protein